MLCRSFKGGHAEKFLLDKAINLKQTGYQFTIVHLNPHDIKMFVPKDLTLIQHEFIPAFTPVNY